VRTHAPQNTGLIDLDRYVPAYLTWIANGLSRGASHNYRKVFGIGIESWRCLVLLAIHKSISAQRVSPYVLVGAGWGSFKGTSTFQGDSSTVVVPESQSAGGGFCARVVSAPTIAAAASSGAAREYARNVAEALRKTRPKSVGGLGTVRVKFTIAEDGGVASVEIAKSSGNKRLDDTALDRTGIHPKFGEVTLRQLLATWTVHDLNHLMQISRVIARQLKPDVGPWVEFLKIVRDT
jgi:hypothetical protein